MTQQPDHFFREKLAQHAQTPPSAAWERIEAGLERRPARTWWWRAAAAVAVLGLAGVYVFYSSTETNGPKQYAQENPRENIQPKDVPAPTVQQEVPSVTERKEETAPAPDLHKQITPRANAIKLQSKQDTPSVAQVNTTTDQQQQHPTPVPDVNTSSTETITTDEVYAAASTEDQTSSGSMTLVYTPGEIDQYLDKKALTEATPQDKKPSTLKKLLKRAYELKSNQDPIGELRQKKNEILALNFKQDKQRGQNK